MRLLVRALVGLVAGMLAIVFLGSVVCPPVGERTDPGAAEERAALGDPDPAPARAGTAPREGAEGPGRRLAEEAGDPARTHDLAVVVRDADTGIVIPDARVELRYADAAGNDLTIRRRTDDSGRIELERLGGNSYRVFVAADGYFEAENQLWRAPSAVRELEFALRAGGLIKGTAEGVDGSKPVSGLIRLTAVESGDELLLPIDFEGRFSSPALAEGVWRIDFLEHRGAEPDLRITMELPLVARARRIVHVTMERRGMRAEPGKVVGTVLVY